MTDWTALTARAGRACHDLVGWLMWDPDTIARYEALGVPNGAGWLLAWRIAPLGDISPAAAAAATYSVAPAVVDFVMGLYRGVADTDAICAVRDESVIPGLEELAPGLPDQLAPLADDLWRGVDAVHHGARPMFAALRAQPRPSAEEPALSAWLAANCLRELRGDNHWALCAAADLDDVEVGLLHSAMVDVGGVRRRGVDRPQPRQRRRRRPPGMGAPGGQGSGHRCGVDRRRATVPPRPRTPDRTSSPLRPGRPWARTTTRALCDAVEAHHDALLERIDATAGPRWMPAARQRATGGLA